MSRTRKIKLCLPGRDEPQEEIVTFVNPGEWFKKRWLVGVGSGFFCIFYIVEADNEQDAIDELTDSEWGGILKTDDLCDACEKNNHIVASGGFLTSGAWDNCTCTFAGNYSDRVDLDDIRILERIGR